MKTRITNDGTGDARRGSAMLLAVIAITVLAGMCGAVMTLGLASQREQRSSEEVLKAQYMAEAGISNTIANMVAGSMGDVGSQNTPVTYSSGRYWVRVEEIDPVNLLYRLTSHGSYQHSANGIEVVVKPVTTEVYQNVIFAGNSSGDPNYTLEFDGSGAFRDRINGDVYSGGNVSVSQDAQMNGDIRAEGTITGAPGSSGISQPIPDFAAMDYATTCDFNVSQMFATATYQANALGGSAWQMPNDSAVHIFRKNPSDRDVITNATPGDDYFLEDPYEDVHPDTNQNGSDATKLTLSGVGNNPGPYGNHKVYYVEGNLWVHNLLTNSFKFFGPQNDPSAFTIVVKGNIYIADNIFYLNQNKDGLALVALKDPDVPDSGNIVLGDPLYGTIREVDAFLYAEYATA